VATPQTQTLNRGRQAWGTLTPDFIRNGTAPYYSDHDLFFWPEDFANPSTIYSVVADTNSWTGNYVDIPSGGDFYYFNTMYMLQRGTGGNPNHILAGQNIPAGPVVVSFSHKCPVLTSFDVTIKAIGVGTTVGGPTTVSCSTSYQTDSIMADFTSYSGQALDLVIGSGDVKIAWMAVMPYAPGAFTPGTSAHGFSTLASGTVTVSNAAACAAGTTCKYTFTNCGLNGSTGVGTLSLGTVSAGVSFIINSESSAGSVVTGDTSKVCWSIN